MIRDLLARRSQHMAAICLVLIIAMLLVNGASWLFPSIASLGPGFALSDKLLGSLQIDLSSMPGWQRAGGILFSSVPLLPLVYGLVNLRKLFRGYAESDYFSEASAIRLGRAGRSVAYWVLLSFICTPLLSAWATMLLPVGQRMITISFEATSIVALFLSACIAIVARILAKASKVDAENRQFV